MFKYTEGLIRDDACNNLGLLAKNTEEEVCRFMTSCVTDIKILAESAVMRNTDMHVDKKLLEMKKIQDYYKRFEDITMIDTKGRVITSTTYNYRGEWRSKKWFLEAIKGNVYVSDAHVILDPYKVVLVIAVPLIGENGKIHAVLVGQLNMERLWEIVDSIAIGNTGFVTIMNEQQYYVAHPNKGMLFRQAPFDPEKKSGVIDSSDSDSEMLFYSTEKYTSTVEYESPKWRIVVAQEKRDALSNLSKLKNNVIYILIISFFLVIVISIFVSKGIVKPVQTLIQGMSRVSDGDLSYKTSVKSRDEIGLLGVAFNDMLMRLNKAHQELQIKTEELHEAFNKISLLNVTLEKRVEERTKELREKQHQLVQAGKLAAIGQLGAGVAHELNNPITGILGYTQFMLDIVSKENLKIEEVYTFKKYLHHIENGSRRCKEIIQNLLQFARKSPEDFVSVNVNNVVKDALSLIECQLLVNKIEVIKNLAPDIKQVDGNHVQLQQVFTDIIINAQQAMPEGGQLFISTRNENGNVAIEFKDTGCGIPEKYKDRIFEPFFTTKTDWKGTGLGLSICYDIIKNHSGNIVVDSQLGKGSVFTIILPVKNNKNVLKDDYKK
ncbi:MAG: cache domain-containing protein [Candidatus Brocadiaceae bacterium]|nr:cache domain-containing protein [Candidatus Brocadiaceae bacterium]